MSEVGGQEGFELIPAQLVDMERVVVPMLFGVDATIGCGDNEKPTRYEHAGDRRQHPLMVINVLDSLEADDGVEGSIGEG
jgi:hypothetical protein